jgi:ABC-type Fe3+-hydroxamate transport system substrate-binding protein
MINYKICCVIKDKTYQNNYTHFNTPFIKFHNIMFFIDQVGNQITLDDTPKRIISLVPSQTEFLYDIGLQDSIVGITKFCIHPKDFFKKTNKIGGTKDFRFEIIDNLQPDLILANKEENYKEGIEKL